MDGKEGEGLQVEGEAAHPTLDLPYMILPTEERPMVYDFNLDYALSTGDAVDAGEYTGRPFCNDPMGLLERDLIRFEKIESPSTPSSAVAWLRRPEHTSVDYLQRKSVEEGVEVRHRADSFAEIQGASKHPTNPEIELEYEVSLFPDFGAEKELEMVGFDRPLREGETRFFREREACALYAGETKTSRFVCLSADPSTYALIEVNPAEDYASYRLIERTLSVNEVKDKQ